MVKCFKLLIFFLFSLSMITCVNANNDFNSLDSAIRNNDVVTLTNDVVISDDEKNNYSDGIIINKNVVIDGNGYSIDARGITRIFKIRKGKMTIKNVALKNGRFNGDGGAISLSKTLPFNFCDVRLDVVNSTFVNNTASGSGGAISFVGRLPFLFFGGKLDVINSTFINNTASGSGGAISTNHIIIHNHVNYNRFVNNTAGIKGGSISNRFFDSIDNNWFGSNDIDDQIYGKQPVRYFIINTTGDGTNLFYNFRLNDTQDTNGYRFPSFNGEIYLNNVFNRTFDASMNNQCFNFNLHDNITIKVDNFEYNYTCIPYLSDVYVSSSGSDLNNGSKDSPVKEFNTAMDYVKDGGTVHVLDDLNLDKTVNILKNITIKSDDGLKTLNGNNMQIFNISPNFNVNISNLKLTNGFASYGGAVYSNKSNLNLSNCIFDSNNVEINGGAVFITGGVNYLNNCTFINNQAENEGGGIITDNMSTRCYFNECNISNNVAKYGGGISAYKGIVEVRNSTINGNVANSDGGGANIVNGTGDFIDCNITHNNANKDGGGISIYTGLGRIRSSNISSNGAFNGGGIKNNCWCMVEGSSLIYNAAENFGGGIYNTGNSIGLSLIKLKEGDKTRLYSNIAFDGGGLYDDKGNAVFNGTSIHFNEAIDEPWGGGGIYSRNLDVKGLFDGIMNDCSDNKPIDIALIFLPN